MKRKVLSIARAIVQGFVQHLASALAKGAAMIVAAVDVKVVALKHVALVVEVDVVVDAVIIAIPIVL